MNPLTKNKKVLIIDDDNDILDVLNEALTMEGYEVRSLPQTDNIFPEILQYQPDIVILDYILNGANGGELCHQIKINRHTMRLPVVLMSAYPRVQQSIADYGANAFIPKPFDLNEVITTIEQLIAATPAVRNNA